MNGPPDRKPVTKPAAKPVARKPATKKPVMPTRKPQAKPKAPAKNYTVEDWDRPNEGKKILIYADTGMGKTTLSSLAPNPAFLGLDEGGRELVHPLTGKKLKVVPNVDTYQDVRNVLQQHSLFNDFGTVVIDTVTILQDWAVPHMLDNIPTEKGGKVNNIVGYGYHKGYQHLYDLMKFILQDCDALIHAGKNVILVAQATSNRVSNPGGDDYLRDGPRLYAGKPSVEALYCEWADYIFRIDYQDVWVTKQDKKDVKGKATGDTTRVIYAQPEVYFRAKSKPPLEDPVISFSDKTDDSVWKFLFGGG